MNEKEKINYERELTSIKEKHKEELRKEQVTAIQKQIQEKFPKTSEEKGTFSLDEVSDRNDLREIVKYLIELLGEALIRE